LYNSGYSVSKPFGNSGVCKINSSTGICQYKAVKQGRYAVAIEVSEYRNGKLLSTVRRDVQLIVLASCPPNDPPFQTNNSGWTNKYSVEEGETICFDVSFQDTNTQNGVPDSIYLDGGGDLFDGSVSPKATISPSGASGSISGKVCWTRPCGSNRTAPYAFTVTARDNGCPRKQTILSLEITVKPFNVTNQVTGPDSVCQFAKGITYAAKNQVNGHTYTWTVTGGTIATGQGTSSITVDWTSAGSGTVSFEESNAGGCKGGPFSKNIIILTPVALNPLNGPKVVCEYSAKSTFTTTKVGNDTYQWFVEGGTITSANNGTSIDVTWGARGSGRVKMVQTNSQGCSSDTNYWDVTITYAEIKGILGTSSVCPHVKGIDYFIVQPDAGASYYWTITGGTQSAGGTSDKIQVNWGSKGWGKVSVVEISAQGCISDTLTMPVKIDYVLDAMVPLGDTTVCAFTNGVPYEVSFTRHSSYAWIITGGKQSSGGNTNQITVDWGASGQGIVEMVETSYDSVTNQPCASSSKQLYVRIAPLPQTTQIAGNMKFCATSVGQTYTANGNPNSLYLWTVAGILR
jgi:hypothetical protein